MTNTDRAPFTPEEWSTLCKSPVLVFLLVAAIDGKVDQKEVTRFIKVLREAATYKSELLRRVLMDVMDRVPALLDEILTAGRDAGHLLTEAKKLAEAKLSAEEADLFKRSLLYVGHQIAESSGGFLGFGAKVSKEEKAALGALAVILDVQLA